MPIEWKPRRLEMFVVGAVIIGLWFVVAFAAARARSIKRGEWCQSNLKQVGLAMMQYTRDYDEKYPLARNWSESLYPYAKNNTLFNCPSAPQHGYSLNSQIGIVTFARFKSPSSIPMVFESSILKKSQHDDGASWLSDSRHPQGMALVYMDGHAEWLQNPPPFKPVLWPEHKTR